MKNRRRVLMLGLLAVAVGLVGYGGFVLTRPEPRNESVPAPAKDDLPPRNLWDGVNVRMPSERPIPKR